MMPSHDNGIQSDFEVVWRQYPRKTAKSVARKAWNRLKPDTATVQAMLDALVWQKQTDQWQRGIIPHFSTWLNQERWTDEKPSTLTLPVAVVTEHDKAIARAIRERDAQQKIEQGLAYFDTHPLWRPDGVKERH